MFLRFSKGAFDKSPYHKDRKRSYLKAVLLGESLVMEYNDSIIAIAKLHEETPKCFDYDIVVAAKHELGAAAIARRVKDMIGKSNKFAENPSQKRRKYFVDEIDCETLPINAQIKFSRIQ